MGKALPLLVATVLAAAAAPAAELVIAANGTCDYQVVVPDKSSDEIVDHWLGMTARLVQAAFARNGFTVAVVTEGEKAPDKPGIHLGATRFAKQNGVNTDAFDDWTYHLRTVGRDLVIAGHDQKDPRNTVRGTSTPLARLGTVKGACDFLRTHLGVRFLFVNMDQSQYNTQGGGLGAFNPDGSLHLDTRSIAFTPIRQVAVPDPLDLKKTPLLRACCDSQYETFHYIAMGFFPLLSSVQGSEVCWYKAVPPATYAKPHPEYFALTKDGQRACDLKLGFDDFMQYCVTSPGVQDLVYQAAETLVAAGQKTITIATMDGYRLCQCNCEACNRLFGTRAESWEQIYARGRSGKLWQAYFSITERLRATYPDVRVVLLNYQDTPVNQAVIRRFPDNVVVKIQFASQLDFDRLAGVEFPAGICGFEETFTGFGQAGPYLPERTPKHMAEVVQAMARNNVKWSVRDGALGYVRGLQAPAYYVYGRMLDDPTADWQDLYNEFCTAAFGDTARQMTRFFDLLHDQIAIYSDFFGVFMPAWSREYSRSAYHDSKWHVMSMYTPEYCAEANALLTSAEKVATDPDVKARLHLVRIEFDYVRKMARIFYLQNAWTMNPAQAYLDPLVEAIDDWHADLARLAGGTGRDTFRPLDDWPEMRPFNGHFYSHAALVTEGYQQQWNRTCLNWDTQAIRAGILTDPHRLAVTTVDTAPALDAKAWNDTPESPFRERGGMPFGNVRTSLRVLRDRDNLYVRIQGLWPARHPEDLFAKGADGDVLSQEYVELGIRPPNSAGKVFRLAVNPVADSRYDSIVVADPGARPAEDKTWNGAWEYAVATSLERGPWTLPSRVWTAWFRIPFASLGTGAPAPGEIWGFNAGRNRGGQYLVWKEARSAADPQALGELAF